MVTGFRWAVGGASEYFGITPDLATYGKGMANGWPLAAIVGRADLMEYGSYVSGTFGGEAVSLAACQATLAVYRKEPVIQQMWAIGRDLMQRFNTLAAGSGLSMTGYPVHPRVVGERRDAFLAGLAQEGILLHPAGFNISLSHSVSELDETLSASKKVLASL
jgi:glutamate-1-semialdehyde aminotransferase